jgi:Flp pilus assembly protein TadD
MPNDGSSEKPSAQLQTAVGLRQLGKLEQAQIICEQLVRTGQFEAEALHQLGIIAYQRKQFSRAVELIDKAIAINPTDWPAPGSEDTELRCLMEREADHGETEVYAGVQA